MRSTPEMRRRRQQCVQGRPGNWICPSNGMMFRTARANTSWSRFGGTTCCNTSPNMPPTKMFFQSRFVNLVQQNHELDQVRAGLLPERLLPASEQIGHQCGGAAREPIGGHIIV